MNHCLRPLTVLVLDGNQRSALAVTRSLGRRGVRVITADSTAKSLAGQSRYSIRYLQYPAPENEPRAFIDWLRAVLDAHGIGFVQPVTEVTTQVVLEARGQLPASCVVPFPEEAVLKRVIDKAALLELAKRAGVPAPHTEVVNCGADSPGSAEVSYPAVMKPALSRIPVAGRWIAASVAIVGDAAEYQRRLGQEAAFRDHRFLLQQYVPGHGAAVFALYDRGRAIAFFAHRRIREKPPSGGVSVLSESVAIDPVMLDHARRLLDAVDWHGVAMVEFRVGPGGVPYLMEINTRFWGSLQLAIDSGVDFPWMLYQLGCGHAIDPPQEHRVGRRLRWFLGDLDSLYLRLRDPGTDPRQKIQSLLEFLVPRPLSTRHEVFRWSDPGPGIYEFQQYVLQLVRRRSG